jgi:hypothetical protein
MLRKEGNILNWTCDRRRAGNAAEEIPTSGESGGESIGGTPGDVALGSAGGGALAGRT